MNANSTREAAGGVVAGARLRKTRQDPLDANGSTPSTPAGGLPGVVARPSRAPSGARLGRDNGNGSINDERPRPNYTLDGTQTPRDGLVSSSTS